MEKAWTLKKNNSGKWFLTFTALIESENCPSADEIHLEAKRKGIKSSSLISKKTIEDYLKKHTGSGIEPVSLPLELDPNFDARITTNNDKTAAYLYVRKAADSANEVDMSTINRLLQRSNIANIDTEKVKGWALLRKSLHESLMPINIEAQTEGGAAEIAKRLKEFLKNYKELDLSKL